MKSLPVRIEFEKKTNRILDIGSGNNCLDIATHLIDLMPNENLERGGNLELTQGKIFQQGSIEQIPFPDRHFDFVQASHVLEHVDSPEKAISELTRVSSVGYIETPAPVMEQGCFFDENSDYPGWNFHRWYVWCFPKQDKIFFKPKTSSNLRSYCTCKWGNGFREILKRVNLTQIDPFIPYFCKMTQLIWREKIAIEVWNETQQGVNQDGFCNCFYAAFFVNMNRYFKSWPQIRRRFVFRKRFPEIYQIAKNLLNTGPL